MSGAMTSSTIAIESLNNYRNALKRALDSDLLTDEDKDLQWRQVTDAFDNQARDVNESNQKFSLARFIEFIIISVSAKEPVFIPNFLSIDESGLAYRSIE